ncbi:uncharacterized protein LOC118767170 [Octopus sinensis]|uniref:Uncharacterized protein LOC118767170 n=1 Tax=Octopus sinensis TaxID=2607531 RepID=A0A7E6FJZ4_9MOLL|nr:uncharacterized protein LOC118767170 [Octopus sinensis]XP_036367203.1 uncharacterized protein LOC118767170 [Octopus sinensis]
MSDSSHKQRYEKRGFKPMEKEQLDVVHFPNNPIITNWERLEKERLKKLDLGFNRLQGSVYQIELAKELKKQRELGPSAKMKRSPTPDEEEEVEEEHVSSGGQISFNQLAPFKTYKTKHSCGYFFDYENQHKRIRRGIPPCNLPYWQSRPKY